MAAAVWLSSLDGNKIGDIHADRKEPEEFVVSRVDRPCAIVKANKLHLNCATRDSTVYTYLLPLIRSVSYLFYMHT